MVNKVILIGNVGQDPEIRVMQNGAKIATFSIATTENWKDKDTGERKSITQWHRVVVFNESLARVIEQYVRKGSKLYIEGSLRSRKYTGNDGIEKNITEVVLNQFRGELQMLDSRNSSQENNAYSEDNFSSNKSTNSKDSSISSIGDDLDDEIPF